MTGRRHLALAFLILAAVCFGLVLASIIGSDFVVNEPAFATAGFLSTVAAMIVERLQ